MKDRPSALRALSALIESLPDEITVIVKNGQTQARLVLPPADPSLALGRVHLAQPFRHTPDYRHVNWHGHVFRFSKTQGAVVELLDMCRNSGEPEIHQSIILEKVGSEATRLTELFRRGDGARAWGLLIVQGSIPGHYCLADRPPAEGQP